MSETDFAIARAQLYATCRTAATRGDSWQDVFGAIAQDDDAFLASWNEELAQ